MFWGLIMEPNKRYSQTVDKSFHVSMASLEIPTADDNVVQVMVCYEDKNYLLCSLKKSTTWQVPLDLNFKEGTKIAFTCNGHGLVHLTGYHIEEDLDELEEEEEEEDEDELVPQLVEKQSKRKALESLKNEKKVKRPKQEVELESSDDEDDAELDGVSEDMESDECEEEEESILEEDAEDDSEDDDDDDDEEEEEEEVVKKPVKSQQKDKKNKQQQKNEENKKKLVNGKEAKQEEQSKQEKKKKGEHQNAQNEQKKRVVEGGVQVEDLKTGNGAPAKPGRFITVYYVGRLKNGKKFDSTTQGEGFKFRLGKGEVIRGWDVGITGMKVGGKRRITIPPALAYGARGSPPLIPGNSTLVFEVELRNIH